MEVVIRVPHGTDVSIIELRYDEPTLDDEDIDGEDVYFFGSDGDQTGEEDWFGYDECVELCGYVDGAIEAASALIDGNGPWAQGMISRKNFDSFAISPEAKKEYKRISDLYWKSFEEGSNEAQKWNQER